MGIVARITSLTLALASTGCSYHFDTQVQLIDGKLAFNTQAKWFGGPECIRAVVVEAEAGPAAEAAPGDDLSAVKRGVYWEEWLDLKSCENQFPLFYGATLAGKKLIFDDGTIRSVKPKSLVRGVVYEYLLLSDGSGSGGGKFKISENGQVINLQ